MRTGSVIIPQDQQDGLIRLATALGYPVDVEGICFGVACMGAQAILAGESDIFYERLRLIANIPLDQMVAKIKEIRKMRAKGGRIQENNDKDNKLSINPIIESIPAFFEGVHLYHNVGLNPQLFFFGAVPKMQHVETIAPIVLSTKLAIEMKESIAEPIRFSGVYDLEELTTYFALLRQSLIKNPYSIALILANSNHAITVGFDPMHPDKWIYINADSCGDEKVIENKGVSQEEIALKVLSALSKKDCAIFSTEIYALKGQEKECKESVAEWKKQDGFVAMHNINEKKAFFLDDNKSSLLYVASASGQLKTVNELLAKGVSVDAPLHHSGSTAFMIAAKNGHIHVMEALLKSGARLNQTRFLDGSTALIAAAEANQLDSLNLLLSQDNINIHAARKSDGATAFAFVIKYGNLQMIDLFLKKGADLNQKCNNQGVTPLMIAASEGYLLMIDKMLTTATLAVNSCTENGETALFFAVQGGHLDAVKSLLTKNPDVNKARYSDKMTALHMAIKKGYVEIAKVLLQAGASLDLQSDRGSSDDLIPTAAENRAVRVEFLKLFKEHRLSLRTNRGGNKNPFF